MKSLLILFFLPSLALASFDENSRRYLSGPELMWSMARVIPRSTIYPDINDVCEVVNEKNSSALGVSDPALGDPLSPHPHIGTVQWIQDCVDRYFVYMPLLHAPWTDVKNFIGANFWNQLRRNPLYKDHFAGEERWEKIGPNLGMWLSPRPWKSMTSEEKSTMVSGLIFSILGPDEIIADFGFTTREKLQEAMIRRLDQRTDLIFSDALKILTLNLILREEFLSY